MQTIKDLKKFAMRGNVVDMAIGIIIGTAFGKIISSLVKDIIMPPLGLLLAGVDFSKLSLVLRKKTETADAITINYGVFSSAVMDFVIITIVLFMLIKLVSHLNKKEEKSNTETSLVDCPRCFTKISIKATRCPNCTSEI